MEEAKGLSYQLDLFPEISGFEGHWLDFPYDFGRIAADLEALCLEYARHRFSPASLLGPR